MAVVDTVDGQLWMVGGGVTFLARIFQTLFVWCGLE
jgi:hypothetical protein